MNLIAHRIRKTVSIASMPFRLPFVSGRPTPERITHVALSNYGIRSVQVESELLAFAKFVRDLKPKTVMEIGTCNGGTLLVLCRTADPEATIISVDLPHWMGGKYGGGYRSFQIPIFEMFPTGRQKLHLLQANSHGDQTRERVSSLLGPRQLDLLFVDGDHTYAGVRSDFELYTPFVRKGGVVAFHDVVIHPPETNCEVHKFWNEVKKQYRWSEIIENPSQGWAGIGIITI